MVLWSCREIQSHIPEPFWYIAVSYRPDPAAANEGQQQQQQQQGLQQRRQGQPSCEFKWARDRLFDQGVATMLYEQCAEEPTATVMQASAAACTKGLCNMAAAVKLCLNYTCSNQGSCGAPSIA
jgi:DNA topoisomerase-3